MRNYQKNYLKEKLLSEKGIAQDILKGQEEINESSNPKEDISELSSYDNHPADMGSEVYEQEKNYALTEHNNQHLKDIEDSLEKLENGGYGICESCGKDIGFERLNAHPTAKLCIGCQESEVTHDYDWDEDRPVEEELLGQPFDRSFTDGGHNLAYDGEDVWQDVQRYGSSSGPQDISSSRPIDYENAYYDSQEKIGLTERVESIDNEEYRATIRGTDEGNKGEA